MTYDVIVIGGGPAGMMAASAAATTKSVLLIERNDRLGRKLLITGKGRCNITNNCNQNSFMENVPTNSRFMFSAINAFTPWDTMDYFEKLGVELKTERGSRVFPRSDKAADVCAAMVKDCKAKGVSVVQGRVIDITTQNGSVSGVKLEDGTKYSGSAVILATGGKSYPLTGSDGDGYAIAESLGHTVVLPKPSLVPIVSYDSCCADMQGLSLKNVELSLFDTILKKVIFKELGELLFTHFGVSGPLVLSASAHIRQMERERYIFSIDLKPGLDEKQLDARLLRDFQKYANKDFANSLGELLPRKMIPIVVMRSEIPPLIKVNQITKDMRMSLIRVLKSFKLPIDDFRPIDEAIITSGGINVKEIVPKTMESKLVKGLYFAGEVIDVDGYTGGFNLQIAFSTGYLAGLAASQY